MMIIQGISKAQVLSTLPHLPSPLKYHWIKGKWGQETHPVPVRQPLHPSSITQDWGSSRISLFFWKHGYVHNLSLWDNQQQTLVIAIYNPITENYSSHFVIFKWTQIQNWYEKQDCVGNHKDDFGDAAPLKENNKCQLHLSYHSVRWHEEKKFAIDMPCTNKQTLHSYLYHNPQVV